MPMDKGKDKGKKLGLGDELFGTRLGEYRDAAGQPKGDKDVIAPKRQGNDLFIVDNSDSDWKVKRYFTRSARNGLRTARAADYPPMTLPTTTKSSSLSMKPSASWLR